MHIRAIRTRTLFPPKDSLLEALYAALPQISEQSVIALSSKAVAIGEGRCIPVASLADIHDLKERVAIEEADAYVPREAGRGRLFTIVHGTLMGSAGIDESNGNQHLILWPKDPMETARRYLRELQQKYQIKNLGVIITDSHSIPLHNGALGIAIGYAGFLPIKDYRGSPDLFGRAFKVERLNVADSLAVAASLVMGEGDESTPAVLIEAAPHVVFTETMPTDAYLELTVPREEDYFRIFLKNAPWKEGGGGYDTL